MKRYLFGLPVVAVCVTMFAGATNALAADKCKHETCWGAVGFSTSGAPSDIGFSYWYSSESGAAGRVKKECPACDVIKTFANSCGQLAVSSNGNWGFATGANRDEAAANGVSICTANGGTDCKRRVWSCSLK